MKLFAPPSAGVVLAKNGEPVACVRPKFTLPPTALTLNVKLAVMVEVETLVVVPLFLGEPAYVTLLDIRVISGPLFLTPIEFPAVAPLTVTVSPF